MLPVALKGDTGVGVAVGVGVGVWVGKMMIVLFPLLPQPETARINNPTIADSATERQKSSSLSQEPHPDIKMHPASKLVALF
ncbi:MAG TPA: hypothetical protein VN754_09985 [Candidatus Binataceae bacterium]|nr:hypothetical protein [Candidatus Binataceae bacterium]